MVLMNLLVPPIVVCPDLALSWSTPDHAQLLWAVLGVTAHTVVGVPSLRVLEPTMASLCATEGSDISPGLRAGGSEHLQKNERTSTVLAVLSLLSKATAINISRY